MFNLNARPPIVPSLRPIEKFLNESVSADHNEKNRLQEFKIEKED